MKFSNRYLFNFGGSASGLKEKLQKLLGMTDVKTEMVLEGEMSCDISVDELKEIFSSENDRIAKLREYIASGDFKSDIVKVTNAIGQVMIECENVQRSYDSECSKTRVNAMWEEYNVEKAREELSKQRNEDRRKAAKEAAEAEKDAE